MQRAIQRSIKGVEYIASSGPATGTTPPAQRGPIWAGLAKSAGATTRLSTTSILERVAAGDAELARPDQERVGDRMRRTAQADRRLHGGPDQAKETLFDGITFDPAGDLETYAKGFAIHSLKG